MDDREILPYNFFDNEYTPAIGYIDRVNNIHPLVYAMYNNNPISNKIVNYTDSVGLISANNQNLGTAFLIDSKAIMLSKHSIIDLIDKSGKLKRNLYFKCPATDRKIKIQACLEDGYENGNKHDYVILSLEEKIKSKPIKIVPESSPDHCKQPFGNLWTLHYPQNKYGEQALSIGESGSSQYKTFSAQYAMNTFYCSSGSPIISTNGEAIGIHKSTITSYGYRTGELFQTIFENNDDSILVNLSNGGKIDYNKKKNFVAKPLYLNKDERLEGIFHNPNKPEEVAFFGRGKAKDTKVATDLNKTLVKGKSKENNRELNSGNRFKKTTNDHQKNELKVSKTYNKKISPKKHKLAQCHRISARDIQVNICEKINNKKFSSLDKFIDLIYYTDLNDDYGSSKEEALNLSKEIKEHTKNKDWVQRTIKANRLYTNLYNSPHNLSLGNANTNSSIGEALDLDFIYDPIKKKYSLSEKSELICKNYCKFSLTKPKIINKEIYSSHIINAKKSDKYNFDNPSSEHRTIRLKDLDRSSIILIEKCLNPGRVK